MDPPSSPDPHEDDSASLAPSIDEEAITALSNDVSVNSDSAPSNSPSDASSAELNKLQLDSLSQPEVKEDAMIQSVVIDDQLNQPDAPEDFNPLIPLQVLLESRRETRKSPAGEVVEFRVGMKSISNPDSLHAEDREIQPATNNKAADYDMINSQNPLQILLMKRVDVVSQDPPESRRSISMEATGEKLSSLHNMNDGKNDLQALLVDKRGGRFASRPDPDYEVQSDQCTNNETNLQARMNKPATDSAKKDHPKVNTGILQFIELPAVRQRRAIQPDSIGDVLHMDPPASEASDVELGRNNSQSIPLVSGTALSYTTTETFQSSLHERCAKSAKTIGQHLLTSWFGSKSISAERLTALIILIGIAYLFIDPVYLESIHLDDKHLSYEQLSHRLSKAQERLNKTLNQEYGKYADLLWSGHGFTSNSIHRLRRRMMFKMFSVGKMREHEVDIGVNFTWVTAGDGAAAGYGNLFHQAYTQIIEDTVKDSFNAVGLHFVANNYAMDGMNSGPELALCIESIYGFDIDILNYDFHETDKDADELYQLWANRAGIHPTMPTLFVNRVEPTRARINSQLETVGLSTLGFNVDSVRSLLLNISSDDDLPYALEHYICDKTDESQCESFKWDMEGTSCDLSEFQTKSRVGWKDHLLVGRAIGVFLIQQLRLALDEMNEASFASNTISNISYSQEMDRKSFMSSSLHEVHEGNHVSKNTEFLGGLARFSPFWKTNAYCRTALLPNQARFDRVSTMGSQGQRHAGGFHSGYEIGHSINDLPTPQTGQSELMLVYNPESKHNCSSTYHIDYKDFFGIRPSDGWVHTLVPNEMENDAFNYHITRSAHVFILCDSIDTPISVASVASNGVSITINGVSVEQVHNLKLYGSDSNCYMLYGKHTFLWPNKVRQFELSIKVNAQASNGDQEMMHLSSIIII